MSDNPLLRIVGQRNINKDIPVAPPAVTGLGYLGPTGSYGPKDAGPRDEVVAALSAPVPAAPNEYSAGAVAAFPDTGLYPKAIVNLARSAFDAGRDAALTEAADAVDRLTGVGGADPFVVKSACATAIRSLQEGNK